MTRNNYENANPKRTKAWLNRKKRTEAGLTENFGWRRNRRRGRVWLSTVDVSPVDFSFILYEDNQAAILMINASRPIPRSWHIDIQLRYPGVEIQRQDYPLSHPRHHPPYRCLHQGARHYTTFPTCPPFDGSLWSSLDGTRIKMSSVIVLPIAFLYTHCPAPTFLMQTMGECVTACLSRLHNFFRGDFAK
jgi:hypothetical protein